MLTSEAERILSEVADAGGLEVSDDDWLLLSSRKYLVPTEEEALLLATQRTISLRIADRRARWLAINAGLTRGVFHLAAQGREFVPFESIDEDPKRGFDPSHPQASETFRRFARSYWTLRAWNTQQASADPTEETIAQVAMTGIETRLRDVLFPDHAADPERGEMCLIPRARVTC